MGRIAAGVAVWLGLAGGGLADSITIDVWTSRNPDRSVSCTVRSDRGRLSAVEVQGPGMPPPRPMRWFAGAEERRALEAAIAAFLSGRLPAVETYSFRLPAPPYVAATWSASTLYGLKSGIYIHKGLDLDPVLDRLIATVLPGGLCAQRLAR